MIDPYMKALLLVLDSEGKQRTIQLKDKASDITEASQTTYFPRIDHLEKIGLVNIEKDGTKRYVSLTEKGKKVAEYLKKIDEIMKG